MNILDEAVSIIANNLARETDAIIREALDRYLGRTDWTPQDLAGRGLVKTVYPDKIEVYSIDGVDLVEFWPVVSWPDGSDNGGPFIRATRHHRILIGKESP